MTLKLICKSLNALKKITLLNNLKPQPFKPHLIARNNYLDHDKWTDDTNITERSTESVAFEKIHLISKLLKCSHITAMQIVSNNRKFLNKDNKYLEKVSKFLVERLDIQDIINNPEVLTLHDGFAHQHYYILQELGFPPKNIKASYLVMFYQLMKKNSMELKGLNLIPDNVDPLENMLRILGDNPELSSKIKEKLKYFSDQYESISVQRLRHVVLCTYLGFKLNLTNEEILKKMETYPTVKNRCLSHLVQIFHLLESNGFPCEKIPNNMYILCGNPDNMADLVRMDKLEGIDFKELIFKNPYLFMSKSLSLLLNCKVLLENGFTSTQIQECPRTLTLKPQTILQRIKDLHKIPELRAMRFHPKFILLIIYYNTALERLQSMKTEGYTAFSVSCLISSAAHFNLKKQYGSDTNMGREMIYYLASLFNKSFEETKNQLSLHPRCGKHNNTVNTEIICNFLLKSGVTKKQLWNTLPIVLYSEKLVKQIFTNLESYPELEPFEEWQCHPQFLDLVVYYIEKGSGFTGDGAFRIS